MFVPFGGDRGDQKTPVPERVDRIHSCTLQVPLHLTKVLLYSPIHHHNTSSQMLEVTGKNRPRKQTDRQTDTHTHTQRKISVSKDSPREEREKGMRWRASLGTEKAKSHRRDHLAALLNLRLPPRDKGNQPGSKRSPTLRLLSSEVHGGERRFARTQRYQLEF
jgi:hypothetical protein